MNFGKALKSIAGPLLGVASTLIPGGPIILGAINAMLPEDNKLPPTATGADMHQAVNNLSPDAKASLMEKELDVEIAEIEGWVNIQESMSKADIAGNSTRPFIALMMAWALVIELAAIIFVWGMAVWSKDNATLTILSNSWGMLAVLIGIPMELLRYYFGKRTKEKQSRYSAMSGQDVGGGLAGIIKAFKG